MDNFFAGYLILLVFAAIGLALFWGTVIYFIVRFFKSDSGLSTEQKIDIVSMGMQAYSGRGGGSINPMDSKAGAVAAGEGIDLNDNR